MDTQGGYNQIKNKNNREKYTKLQYGKGPATANRYQNGKQNGKNYQSRAAPQYPYPSSSYQQAPVKLVRKGSFGIVPAHQQSHYRQISNLPHFFFFDGINGGNNRPALRETPEKGRRHYQNQNQVVFVENTDKVRELHGFKVVHNGQTIHDETSNVQRPLTSTDPWDTLPKLDKFAVSFYLTGPNEKMISIPTFIETQE
jgi:hypothetical protein